MGDLQHVTFEPVDEPLPLEQCTQIFARRLTSNTGDGFSYLGDLILDLLLMRRYNTHTKILALRLSGSDDGVSPEQLHRLRVGHLANAAFAGAGEEIPLAGFIGWFGD